MHRACELPDRGPGVGLAVADGAAEVDLEHRVAAVGEQLHGGVETPGVPVPGAAVHQQHDRQPGRFDPDRQRQVRGQPEPVPRRDRHRGHRGQRLGVQVREGPEQQPALPGGVVVEPGDAGVAVVAEADDPPLPALVGRQRAEVAVRQGLQVLQHRGEVRVECVDHLSFPEVAGPEQLAGPPAADQRGPELETPRRTPSRSNVGWLSTSVSWPVARSSRTRRVRSVPRLEPIHTPVPSGVTSIGWMPSG